jgi:membrane fusion protein, multidrug efflux system
MRICFRFCLPAVLVALAGCGSREPRTAKADEGPAIAVRTIAVQKADWPAAYEATGTVRARTSVQITSRLMAYVREVRVRVGDHVRPGQVLVTLDARDLDARQRQAEAGRTESRSAALEAENAIASARANLELAEATFKRMKDLYDKKSISDQEFDEASTRLKLARANLDMAQSRRQQVTAKIAQADEEVKSAEIMTGYSVVAAPFAGVVTDKPVEPGNLAMSGAPLMTIEQGGGYRLEVAVEESNLSKVKLGQTVPVQLDSTPGEITGRVGEIVPAVDPAARSFTAKIDLPASPQLRSGQFGRARFLIGLRSVVVIPAGAIQERGQIQWVYAVEDGRARTRMVSLGDRSAERAEVLSGLLEGERIVFPVSGALRDGARVEVRP